MQCHVFHSAHGEGDVSAHQTLEERPCGYDIQVGALLVEVAQRLHGVRLVLYLVDEYQRVPAVMDDSRFEEYSGEQVVKGVVIGKYSSVVLLLQVYVYIVVEILGEEFHQCGLAHLSGASQHHRFPFFLFCPLPQIIYR